AEDLLIDGQLAAGSATVELIESLERAGPYGAGNPEPRFMLPSASVVNAGLAGGRHVRCVLATG
ncbi:MAG TPA: single-stranded-DNA-specific exonuclease RecJ, partial [Alphaproteobacteria bacterium]|nr:single-stranded-DNA-specific exonuclease RecJ [Alphaproteobacteria bacterium]